MATNNLYAIINSNYSYLWDFTHFMQDKEKKINKKSEFKNIKNMGIDIDKNEYREIVLSDSNNPEKSYYKKDYNDW